MVNSFYVINSKGEKELFSFQKVYRSARRAGASNELAKKIAEIIERNAFSGIKTSDIFQRVRKLLLEKNSKSALRFSLKQAMQKLGPTGFPFEKYIGEVLSSTGFEVKINQHLPGFCISDYEIDFVAKKENSPPTTFRTKVVRGLIYIGECKYRNLTGERVRSKDALANYARFLDILKGNYFKARKCQGFKIKTMMVTNTKFTKRAMGYSQCMEVELLGWNCPKTRGLEYLIEKHKLYPITILPSLKSYLKDIFISEKMMLAQNVLKIEPERFAKKFKIPIKTLHPLIKEAKILLGE